MGTVMYNNKRKLIMYQCQLSLILKEFSSFKTALDIEAGEGKALDLEAFMEAALSRSIRMHPKFRIRYKLLRQSVSRPQEKGMRVFLQRIRKLKAKIEEAKLVQGMDQPTYTAHLIYRRQQRMERKDRLYERQQVIQAIRSERHQRKLERLKRLDSKVSKKEKRLLDQKKRTLERRVARNKVSIQKKKERMGVL